MRTGFRLTLGSLLLTVGCADPGSDEGSTADSTADSTTDDEIGESTSETGTSTSTSTEEGDGDGDDDSTTDDDDSTTDESDSEGGIKFDVESIDMDVGPLPPSCTVSEGELDAIPPCEMLAPAGSFEPDVQWEWFGEGAHVNSLTTPLVANLTDDNDDQAIDLCDIPDIVILTHEGLSNNPEHLWVLDGETGSVHWDLDLQLTFSQVPAIGDIDGDGLPEIVAGTASNQLVVVEHDGTIKWQKPIPWLSQFRPAFGLADFDNDGDVEIYLGNGLIDHEGNVIFQKAAEPLNFYHASAAADLDGDEDLELIIGRSAYHHDGTPYYEHTDISASHAQIGDLDDDGLPEILLSGPLGVSLLEHTGAKTLVEQTPGGDPPVNNNWRRPAAIHDFDANGTAEFAVSSANHYGVFRDDFSIVWQAPVADLTGVAGGTAFDFLGDGSAEAIYADEVSLFVFDELGQVVLQQPRLSRTTTEYPVVADVDNDGSAEIIVVSESDLAGNSATVQVIRDTEDRWVPARRIWNQHTYHVTNVREDGTIPQFEPPAWEYLNTFRTQAQFEGSVCLPEPQG